MNAIILSIGDELVLGQTVDTNSAWIAQQLSAIGCDITVHHTVPDDRRAIAAAISDLAGRCEVLIISGGLGPTEDDLTREALSDVLQKPLVQNRAWADHMLAFFAKLGRQMPARNMTQAMAPEGTAILWNHNGTAPGIQAEYASTPVGAGASRCTIFIMPGVPKEMKPMFTNAILPWIAKKSGGAVILQKTLHTFGLGESTVAERLGSLMMRQRNPSVGTTVARGMVSLRVNSRFPSLNEAQHEADAAVAACEAALGDVIFGQGDQDLAQVVAGMLKAASPATTVATAESCTGGLLAAMLTDIPGSSAYFKQGWITYSNDAKERQLGVLPQTLIDHGAVSEPVVEQMARGARERSGATVALSISGVAGPDGGTDAKPVGTVCIGFAYANGVSARTFRFTGDRAMIRDRSAKMALSILRYHLLGKAMPF